MKKNAAKFLSLNVLRIRHSYILSSFLSFLFVLSVFFISPVTVNALTVVTDIDGYWAQNDIQKALEYGYIKGCPDSTFKPDNGVTRAEFVTMINGAFNIPLNGTESNFTDIQPEDWFAVNVWSAVDAGYVGGYPDNTFRPNNSITREEAAVLIVNLTKMTGSEQIDFKDYGQIGEWAKQSVNTLASAGIINGYPDGNFHPADNLTRAQAVVIINKLIGIESTPAYNVSLKVTGTVVNIRSGPGTSYDVIGQARQGEILTAIEHSSNDWYKVQSNNSTGWIIGMYVSKITDASRGGDTSRDPGSGGETTPPDGTDATGDTGENVTEKLVVIDPGHGGSDPGALGINGTREKDVNLAIALKVSDYLKTAGFKVIMTRSNDSYVSLDDRSKIANDAHTDIFVSIHSNSYNHTASGTETLVEPLSGNPVYKQQDDSKRLAHLIQNELVQALGLPDRGVREQGLSVCRETNAPAVLVETAFIDNINEERLLTDPAFQKKAAEAIGHGVASYFK